MVFALVGKNLSRPRRPSAMRSASGAFLFFGRSSLPLLRHGATPPSGSAGGSGRDLSFSLKYTILHRMSSALALQKYVSPSDPAELGWPPSLPIEIALRVASVKEICEAHQISKSEWDALRVDPGFQNTLLGYVRSLREEGTSFKMKARLQAEELLKTSWELIHGLDTPAVVKADLIKHTIRFAGLDASIEQRALSQGALNQNNLQININLG